MKYLDLLPLFAFLGLRTRYWAIIIVVAVVVIIVIALMTRNRS